MAYSSTPYVGMALKTNGGHINAYKNRYGHGRTGRSGSYGPDLTVCM